jgi:hypothetical protein
VGAPTPKNSNVVARQIEMKSSEQVEKVTSGSQDI